ncbi:MAG: hypothetical protein Wins2KO_22530 [Winogradskyella sp.]
MKHKTIAILFFLFFSLICLSCKQDIVEEQKKSSIIIGETLTIFSKELKEDRELMISLPKNYERNIHSYPVIIVLDAEYLFELTSAIVKHKVSRNEMPESIVVGIPNTPDGRYDMAMELKYEDGSTFFGDAKGEKIDNYLNFIESEVLTFIKDKFRVNSHASIIGMSPTLGPVFEGLWNRPELFRGYIALAPELAVITNTEKTIEQRLLKTIQTNNALKTSVYIGKASEDLKRRAQQETLAYKNLNQIDSVGNNINYKIEVLQNENHYGMAIKGIENGLETIYPYEAWTIPYRDFWKSENPAQAIETYYNKLSKTYGFKVLPQEDAFYFVQTLTGTIKRFYRRGEKDKAERVLNLALKYYPNSENFKEWLLLLSQ